MEGIIGKTLDKVYRVDQLLGRGGMGAVYRAHDMALNRDVAIKVMHPHFADDEQFRSRFLQEARAIAALSHPGVVQVYAVAQDMGLLYMVMDLIPGQTLHAWLRLLADENKLVALTESLAIVQQVAQALHYAHEKGVLHRDVKPANIMLKPSDRALDELDDAQSGRGLPFRPVLTDFGLAKLAEGGVHTATGTSMGTPAYMSPEQCLGLELDRRSDVYSLGVVLYELATGRVPFDVKSLTAAIRCHTQQPPPAPRSINPSLPAEVETIILRALGKRLEDRFVSAREMALALRAAMPAIPASLSVAPTRMDGPYVSLMTRLAQVGAAPSVPTGDAWIAPPVSMAGRTIVVVAPDGQSRRVALPDKRRVTVGRTADNDLALPEVGISRHHCHTDWDGQNWSVTDLNSTNGTFLGNSRLLPGVSQPWLPNVPLRIGNYWLKADIQAETAAPSALGMPSASALGVVRFEAVWYGTSLDVAAYSAPGYLLLVEADEDQYEKLTSIPVTEAVAFAVSRSLPRFRVRFSFAKDTDGDRSADELILWIDRAEPAVLVEYTLP